MQPGVTRAHLRPLCGAGIRHPACRAAGQAGAGAWRRQMWPRLRHWMCYTKLFIENQVCLLKLNPVNDYLHDLLAQALAPLIAMDALRIVTGDARAGAWLTYPSRCPMRSISLAPARPMTSSSGARVRRLASVGPPDAAEPASGDLGAGRRQPHHYRTRAVERGGHRFSGAAAGDAEDEQRRV
ncbi:aldehyde dehydrogenase [Klebsiella pneumoniae]|uniref:Aldehyde dehydrogenase n=1 Tax=Klebsiella pneumoniae TaxID=573 RepID=A0A2X3F0V0_KLEPN|nr:aldehyde dehydrogenase [Klebsiella pneumoniae]